MVFLYSGVMGSMIAVGVPSWRRNNLTGTLMTRATYPSTQRLVCTYVISAMNVFSLLPQPEWRREMQNFVMVTITTDV